MIEIMTMIHQKFLDEKLLDNATYAMIEISTIN